MCLIGEAFRIKLHMKIKSKKMIQSYHVREKSSRTVFTSKKDEFKAKSIKKDRTGS